MKNQIKILLLLLTVSLLSFNIERNVESSLNITSDVNAPNHDDWTAILNAHVTAAGNVNYQGIKSDVRFNSYIDMLEAVHPDNSWSKNERMAFWINVYNAFTVKLINDNGPVASINDINKPWDQKFIKIENATYSLSDIENNILRKKFNDPRIHFAINCASISCPKLVNKAFTANGLNAQLEKATRSFINDASRNKISVDKVELSKIFDWYKEDFIANGTVIDYINGYSDTKANADAAVSYMNYNWKLNK